MNHAAASGPVTLYHKRRARVERARGLSHLVPALVLLTGAGSMLSGQEAFTLLLGLEVTVGVAYLLLLVRELRHQRRHPHHHEAVAWLELAAAGILALEGYHIWHRHHARELLTGRHGLHVLPWLYAAVAVWYAGMAFGMGRIYERRHLHLHPDGFSGRLGLLSRKFAYTWAEVAGLELAGPADVLVHHVNGQQARLSFKSVLDGPAHRDQLVAHAAVRGGAAAPEPGPRPDAGRTR